MINLGKWALVTGASSGIGRALALEFAQGGYNVLLTARNEAALNHVAGECAKRFRVQAEVVPADLSRPESIDQLVTVLSSKDHSFDVLVNNAGFGIQGQFSGTDIDKELELLNVQLGAALRLTKAVLPGMLSQRSGKILNVGSVYSFAPVPLQAVYSACKAFLLSFSTSLQNELKGTGITITVFCPGITQTEFRSRAGISERHKDSGITAEAAARIAYAATIRGKPVVVPGVVNRIFVLLSRLLPRSSFGTFVRFINRQRGQNL
jgi:uncharacterized protein